MVVRPDPALDLLLRRSDAERKIGPFVLVKPLGRGSFAPVWLAKEVYGDVELRAAAVKLFGVADDATGRASDRIAEEARALCQIEHPNVVRFFSLASDPSGRVLGLAMEYVRGRSLDQALAEQGHVSPLVAVKAGLAIASALAAVHAIGRVHRDVKPANVVEADGTYKLIDFGIASAPRLPERVRERRIVVDDLPLTIVGSRAADVGAEGGDATDLDLLSGTIGYVDPVCMATLAPATPASDLYALGATLFECLTGSLPAAAAARARGESGLRGEVLDGRAPAPPIATIVSDLPPSLARLVDALLEADPSRRPARAELVSHELASIERSMRGRPRALPSEDIGPFRRVRRFERADQDVFFGRAAEIASALEILRGRGLLCLVGPSGSGKSSVACAGVLPAVEDGALGGPSRWDAVVVSAIPDPRADVLDALAQYVDARTDTPPESLPAMLADAAVRRGRGLIVFVDQLERLGRARNVESQSWLLRFIRQLAAQVLPSLRGAVAVRADGLGALLRTEPNPRMILAGVMYVQPLLPDAWRDVVDEAIGAYGYAIDDAALRRQLSRDLRGTSVAMPLVQAALAELWNHRDRVTRRITREGYDAMGGLHGGIELHADAALAAIETMGPDAARLAREMLLSLTTTKGQRVACDQGTILSLAFAEEGRLFSNELAFDVYRVLEQSRLVVKEGATVMLAHDALVLRWRTLMAWMDETKLDRQLLAELEAEAGAWTEDRWEERLWWGRRLALATEAARRTARPVSFRASEFLRCSEERQPR